MTLSGRGQDGAATAIGHMMRPSFYSLLLICLIGLIARPAVANCYVLSQVDKMHQVQIDLLRDPGSPFFRDDIRRLRAASDGLSTPQILRAVDGGNWTGHGADFRRFMTNSLALLQMVSLDDPASVQPHFTAPVRANLQRVGAHMDGLRCTQAQVMQARADQLAIAQSSPLPPPVPPAILAAAILLVMIWAIRRVFWRRILLQRKRATRHGLRYPTRYWWNNTMGPGTLVDINRAGTRLQHKDGRPLPKGAQVDLELQKDWTTGTIVWSDATHSGVRFRDPLSAGKVNRMRTVEIKAGQKP